MGVRTSETDPIRVDWLPARLAGMPGRLGLTFAPGKSARSRFGQSWDRSLGTDLDRLADELRVDCLVTLVEEHEMTKLGISELFEKANERGIDVYWYPVRDGRVPHDEEAIPALVDHMLSRVYSGESVVVHCRGGLGRSGTLGGCCLRSLQYQPERAIELVREARPGAIENSQQEQFVGQYSRGWFPLPFTTSQRTWEYLEKVSDFSRPTPGDYDTSLFSTTGADNPSIRYFPEEPSEGPDSAPTRSTTPSRHNPSLWSIAKEAAAEAPSLSIDELDRVVDRAAYGEPLDVAPPIAAAALLHFRAHPPRIIGLGFPSAPPVRRCHTRGRLLLAATADADRRVADAHAVEEKRQNVRVDHEPTMPDPTEDSLRAVMDICALRIDGYAYRKAHSKDFREMGVDMERHGEYDKFTLGEKLTVFFLLQRHLRKWGGGRTPENGATRRVYRELFVDLQDKRAPRRWLPDEWNTYDAWRWRYGPAAEPYVEMAKRQIDVIDYGWR